MQYATHHNLGGSPGIGELCTSKLSFKKMKRVYMSAPLPFPGQKRRFAGGYREFLDSVKGASVFVDLFGGSGLLSHITKRERPDALVVYNDFDNYRQRLGHIPRTNSLLRRIRGMVADVPRNGIIPGGIRHGILGLLEAEEAAEGFVDYITLSSSLLFPGNNATTLDGLRRHSFYNRLRRTDYDASGYLDGLEITSCDYRELFGRYKDREDVVFIVDPPYLSTDVGTYRMCWRLPDYLDVLKVLSGHNFVYFTSGKSGIMELCDWLGKNRGIGNPFENAARNDCNARLNHHAGYTNIMLCNIA